MGELIEAAGGVVWRHGRAGLQVLVVHRPRYDDWSLPKGKRQAGEAHRDAALREVEEETGLRCLLGAELPSVDYVHRKGRPKRVRYWEMTVVSGAFSPNDEVDRVRWLSPGAARKVCTYQRDAEVIACFADMLVAT